MFVGYSLFDAVCWPAPRNGHRAAQHLDFSQLVLLCPPPSRSLSISLYCPSCLPLSPLLSSLCLCFPLCFLPFCLSLLFSVSVCLCCFLSFSLLPLFLSLFFSISLPVSLFSLTVPLSPSQLLILSLLCLCRPSLVLSLYIHRNLSRYSQVSAVTQVNEQLSFICSVFNLLKVSWSGPDQLSDFTVFKSHYPVILGKKECCTSALKF